VSKIRSIIQGKVTSGCYAKSAEILPKYRPSIKAARAPDKIISKRLFIIYLYETYIVKQNLTIAKITNMPLAILGKFEISGEVLF